MANVIFKVGTKQQYLALETRDPNTLYFLTDTKEFLRGEVLFGTGAEATKEVAGLLSASDKEKLDKLVETGLLELTSVDGSIKIFDGDGSKDIKVAISQESGNKITLKTDGLYADGSSAEDVPEYTIEKQEEAAESYLATYRLKKTVGDASEYVGAEINIPKDLVVQSGSVEKVTVEDQPYPDAKVGDMYIDLVLNDDGNTHIYIPFDKLVDPYTAGIGIEIEDNEIRIKINKNLANGLSATADGLALALATKETAGAMSAEDKKAVDAIPVVYSAKRYEFSSLLPGSRVLENGKEYRVMFAADTDWHKQENDGSNKNYNPNRYYFAMRAYAPSDDVVAFREDTEEIIKDQTIYHFTKEDFGGVDEYGRKYSVVWLPAAKFEDEKWTYFGAASSDSKYAGWHYSVEWLDANNKVVASDHIRVNLSNEGCHNSIAPFYMSSYATQEDIKDIKSGFEWGEL